MRQLLRLGVLFILFVSVSNCATIVRGTSQDLRAESTPSGARVIVNGEDKGATPTTLTLKRNRTHQVIFRLEGYDDITINIDRHFKAGAAIVGNIFSWGLIGIVVDVANGSAYQLTPEELNASLNQMPAMSRMEFDDEHIQVVFLTPEQVSDEIRAKM